MARNRGTISNQFPTNCGNILGYFSPPARWWSVDFIRVAFLLLLLLLLLRQPRISTASSGSQWALPAQPQAPDVSGALSTHCQPQSPDVSGHCRTSTASTRSQCSGHCRIECHKGCQIECQNIRPIKCQIECQSISTRPNAKHIARWNVRSYIYIILYIYIYFIYMQVCMPERKPDRMSEYMPDRMPVRMPIRMSKCASARISVDGDHSK